MSLGYLASHSPLTFRFCLLLQSVREFRGNPLYVLEYICYLCHISIVSWDVEFDDQFEAEFDQFTDPVKTELLARARVLAQFGPALGRPNADTLSGSEYKNMKELRFNADDGVWRIAFVFDPDRKAILLCGGDKKGKDQKWFYGNLIKVADRRFKLRLDRLEK